MEERDSEVASSASQPAIVATMLEQLELSPGHRVLEVGAGSGYNVSLMAHMVGEEGLVVTVEIDEALARRARESLATAGLETTESGWVERWCMETEGQATLTRRPTTGSSSRPAPRISPPPGASSYVPTDGLCCPWRSGAACRCVQRSSPQANI